MAKRYNSNWDAKRLIVNFNQKQWRQDFAAFVKEKKFWSIVRVTRSKTISNNPLDKGIKSFEVYDRYGGSVRVTYQDNNKIINTNDIDMIKSYLEEKGLYENVGSL